MHFCLACSLQLTHGIVVRTSGPGDLKPGWDWRFMEFGAIGLGGRFLGLSYRVAFPVRVGPWRLTGRPFREHLAALVAERMPEIA